MSNLNILSSEKVSEKTSVFHIAADFLAMISKKIFSKRMATSKPIHTEISTKNEALDLPDKLRNTLGYYEQLSYNK